ncbi:MraY family glycosyltransferase [Microbulbifer thermotolerans]|uniref:Glycosyltransferase family 4 protein n=1 Tax=Microbulbifer thermotolerans TaxID=252514 RepID=A0AB35HZ56_MICTH|nr:glycosyltransferase family 4 protein [Microbulbifer thermotolerans]MCX2780000.1 glycosyltransferase family 4 protein [Microbulbifer thermotolerans]MCX2801827.1 glycosyltransferase family 4 protein [Microbulbifer thermotolerans]MCX2805423.1 glycosyltransferase family 4 protein [Microbulbifer thermotolerans]MCX2832050.1 glycosyltransferase family 4 protein [Microbulbifer thermotolerans]
MLMVEWIVAVLAGATVSYGLTAVLLSRMGDVALDLPNHRSMHQTPVPRTGGWALIGGCAVALAISPASIPMSMLSGFALLLAVSVIDDLRNVAAPVRFAVHLLAVALVLLSLPGSLSWWWYPLLLLGGVWMVNLYNFMDGMDGLAGSMTAVGFGTLGLVAAWRGQEELAGVCVLLVVCALVFLRYNWPEARIFLGDAGSTSLGLAAVTVSLFGWQKGSFGLLVPIVVFAPFWLDASFTLMCRILLGKRWWEPHREHVYQRSALRIGVKKTLFWQLGMMLSASILALSLVWFGLA